MNRIIFLITFFVGLFFQNSANAQSIRGMVKDEAENTPIQGATIKLTNKKDSLNNYLTLSDKKGAFKISNIKIADYFLNISSIGYSNLKKGILINQKSEVNIGTIGILKNSKVLNTVEIIGASAAVKQKQDTVEYAANMYKVNPDANAEDLIKKMPGITVDKAGAVTAHGEQVKKVTVDGREFFGDDATAALRNLPSEVIEKIQVFDKLSDQAAFTGFDDGNAVKAINIITKTNMRNGQFGRVYAGGGSNNRYTGGGNVSFFKENRRVSLIGLFNNINQQNFASQDLLGVSSQGGRGGRGGNRGGGAGGFQGGNNSNFLVGAQSGISKTNAFGINFSDLIAKKINVTGSYFYNNSTTPNNQLINEQYFSNNNDSVRYYKENNTSNSNNYNNRINLRVEYKIDSLNSIILTPTLNFQSNESASLVNGINSFASGKQISETNNMVHTNSKGYSINNGIYLRHAFSKRGRTISIGMNNSLNKRTADTYLQAFNKYYKISFNKTDSLNQLSDQNTNGQQTSFNISFTEPLGKKGQLQLNFNPSFTINKADQETSKFDYLNSKYAFLDTSLSNKFTNHFNTQNTGITYRFGDRDNQFAAGISYQHATLNSDEQFPFITTIHKSFNNLLPNLMARFKLSSKSNLRIFYRTSTNPPSINQLQNVINNTNPFFLSTGNPDLKQQYTNNLIGRYTFTNTLKGQSFFANLFLQSTNDYVASATYTARRDSILSRTDTLFRGSQISKPVNLNGFISARSFFTFGLPLKFIKSNLNWNAGFAYSNLPGLINYVSNLSKSYTYNLGAVLSSNISQYIDFNISYSANISNVKNSIQPKLNNKYFAQTADLQFNLLNKDGWFIQNDISNQSYKGLTNGFNQNYWLWNAAFGKKFLKSQNGELKLAVFDLLKQNKNISRNTTETYIQDIQNQVLQQYFMLTFSYKLKTFGKGKPLPANDRRYNDDRGGF